LSRLLYVLIIALLITSCFGTGFFTYDTPDKLDRYLLEFKSAAKERGYNLNIPNHLKVKLVDKLEGRNTIRGECINDIPMIIRLEKDYWMQADSTQRKILLFHEFGHCLLKRKHTNEILPNGEWKSIMRGGSLPENRSYFVNFRGFRKQYYLDELFNKSTPIPDWALRKQKLNLVSRKLDETIKLNDFEHLSDSWSANDTAFADYNKDNSNFTIQNYSDNEIAVTAIKIPFKTDGSFVIDSKLHFSLSEAKEGVGLFFGKRVSLEYMAITPKMGLKFGNFNEFRPYATIPINNSQSQKSYRITLQKDPDELLYFLNDELVYHKSANLFLSDSLYVGFYVAPSNILKINNIVIYW